MFEFLKTKDAIRSFENLYKPRAQFLLYYKIQPKEMKNGKVGFALTGTTGTFLFVFEDNTSHYSSQ